jgi:hypothetical protein
MGQIIIQKIKQTEYQMGGIFGRHEKIVYQVDPETKNLLQ